MVSKAHSRGPVPTQARTAQKIAAIATTGRIGPCRGLTSFVAVGYNRSDMCADPPNIPGGRWVWTKHVVCGIGFFWCRCQNGWTSNWANREFTQKCRKCSRWVEPRQLFVWYNPSRKKKAGNKVKGHHLPKECEACRAKKCQFNSKFS